MSVSLLLTWKQEMIRVQNIPPICFLFHHSERVRVFWLAALFLTLLYLHRSHGDTVSKQGIFPYLSALMYLTHFCTQNSILHRRLIWNTPHEIKIRKESTSPAFACDWPSSFTSTNPQNLLTNIFYQRGKVLFVFLKHILRDKQHFTSSDLFEGYQREQVSWSALCLNPVAPDTPLTSFSSPHPRSW